MNKKLFLLLTVFLVLISAIPGNSAESQELATDYLTRIQSEISSDISRLSTQADKDLSGMSLVSVDINKRINELSALSETVSQDMAKWGYPPEQRELHSRILAEVSNAYSAYVTYSPLTDTANTRNDKVPEKLSEDISSLIYITSPDINDSDAMRIEISKISRELDVQIFYLQSKINKLKLDLTTVATLQKQLKEAQEGGQAIEFPRTHLLELENAKINVALSKLQLNEQKTVFEGDIKAINRLRRRLNEIQERLSFSQETLDKNLDKLQARLKELSEEMTKARKSLSSANAALSKARASMKPSDNNEITNNSSQLILRTVRVSYWEYMLSLINEEIALCREVQQVWRNRYKLFHDEMPGDEIWKVREDSARRILELQRQLESDRTRHEAIIREIDAKKLLSQREDISSTAKQNLIQAAEAQQRIITDIIQLHEQLIPEAIFLQQRLNAEANDNLSALRLAEKVGTFSKETVLGFLATELWQGEGYSVTVSKLVIAILVFLSSFFLSTWGSRWIKRRMIKHKASTTAANAVQRVAFYILWLAFALTALNIVEIPLTAFAFMGGALAVGIGFGMQNFFNNFISGFIVMFSRPFKVHDIVDVAGTQGTVEDIGSRSTTIKTWDGFDVVLPNRYFLENSVTNWTKTDMKKRELLKVGVSYKADSREVERILLEIVSEHSQVLKSPAPLVIFKNFGDYSLEFEIYYWIELKKSSGMKVSSDLRHHIASVFKREGIEIPFPQRVIHIENEKNEEGEQEE